MSDAHPIAPEELFQHAEFLKHLAPRLLKDELEFLDAAGELVARGAFERDGEGRSSFRLDFGHRTRETRVAGPELRFELPVKVVKVRIRAPGCQPKELELHHTEQEQVVRVVALLTTD